MRTIDADALKTRIQKLATEAWKMKIKASAETILNQFIDFINDAPTVSAEPQWIPCSERLPYAEDGDSGVVLVTCGYKNVEDTSIRWVSRLWFDGEYWNDVEGERYNQIVYAWMPLPKPYKEGNKA